MAPLLKKKNLYPHVYGLLGLEIKWWFSPTARLCNPLYPTKLTNGSRKAGMSLSSRTCAQTSAPPCVGAGRSATIEWGHVMRHKVGLLVKGWARAQTLPAVCSVPAVTHSEALTKH